MPDWSCFRVSIPSATACEPMKRPPVKRRYEVTAGASRKDPCPRSHRPQVDLSPKKPRDLSPKKSRGLSPKKSRGLSPKRDLEAGQQLCDGGEEGAVGGDPVEVVELVGSGPAQFGVLAGPPPPPPP